jgi:hypothetical protein
MNFSGPPNITLTNITTALAVDPTYTSANGFSATINWGDGQQSTGRVFYGPSGQWHFYVQGDHLYSAVGSYSVTTTLTDPGGTVLTGTGVGTILNRGVIKRPDVYFKNVGVCRCT